MPMIPGKKGTCVRTGETAPRASEHTHCVYCFCSRMCGDSVLLLGEADHAASEPGTSMPGCERIFKAAYGDGESRERW